MILKVVGSNPTTYLIINIINTYVNKKINPKNIKTNIYKLRLVYIPIRVYNAGIRFFKNTANLIPRSVFFTKWFTKNANVQKLFVYTKLGFLSSGIILTFAKLKKKSLKKSFRVWALTVTYFKRLFFLPLIIWYKNIFNYKYSMLVKKIKSKINIVWIFIKLFYLNFIFVKKKKKSIKKWVYKKQFRLFDN